MEPTQFVLLGIFLVLSAVFSSAESALLSLTQARVNYLSKTYKKGKVVKELKDKQSEVIIAILLGNNLVNMAAAAIATEIAVEVFNNLGVAFATGVMTFLVLTFGEVVPKLFATAYAQSYLLAIASFLKFWVFISRPVTLFYESLIEVLNDYLGKKTDPTITEEELEEMIKLGELEGELGRHERDIILAAMDLEEFTAEDVMVPRDEIFALPEDETVSTLIKEMKKKGVSFTRVPIYKETLDEITGIVNMKAILKKTTERGWKKTKLNEVAFKPLFVSEFTPLTKVMDKMRKTKNLMAIVVDERGIVIGLLTIEDILEVLVGDIYDEVERRRSKIIRTKGAIVAEGSIHTEDLEKELGIGFGDASTLAEFLLMRFKGLPEEGQKISYRGYLFEVKKIEGARIKKVRISREKKKS